MVIVNDEVYKRRLKSRLFDYFDVMKRRLDGLTIDQLVYLCDRMEDLEGDKYDNIDRVISASWNTTVHDTEVVETWGIE